jgi:hypothetical protein
MVIMILVIGWLVRHFGVREVALYLKVDIACNGRYLMSNFYGISFDLFISDRTKKESKTLISQNYWLKAGDKAHFTLIPIILPDSYVTT